MKQIGKRKKKKKRTNKIQKEAAGITFGPASLSSSFHRQVGPTYRVAFYLRPGDLERPDALPAVDLASGGRTLPPPAR
jgi:hypothetical protein